MNPRAIGNFFKSKFGLFVVFLAVLFTGLWLYGRRQAQVRETERLAAQKSNKVEVGQMKLPLTKGLESGTPQQVKPDPAKTAEPEAAADIVPFRPAPPLVIQRGPTNAAPAGGPEPKKAEPPPRKIRYPTLLMNYEAPRPSPLRAEPVPPERFIPFGTLLKCKLVNTVDSANLATPVIALLLEDVWQNGKLVVPANTLIHGTARAGRLRDRVSAAGAWRFVWQDGRELSFNGVALDREYEHDVDGYGITDGSAGIRGRIMATDDLQELKMLAASALSGFARGTQDRQQTALGTTITGSVSNGVREGVGDVFNLYAQRTLKEIEENGYFVRVAAGKEFYVYVLEAVDPHEASIAGVRHRAAATAANAGTEPPSAVQP